MNEDKKKDKSTQDTIRKQLEDMLLGGEQIDEASTKDKPVANGEEQGPLAKVQHPNTKAMDFYSVKDEIEGESKKLLKSVIDFYLDAKVIKKNDYLKYKKAVDEMTLSNIIFSLRTTQHAVIKLMEEIDMGNLHPRIFEVLAQLQNQMMVVVKHQAAYMITLEEGYKKIKDDNDRIEYQRSLDKGKDDEDSMKPLGEGDSLKIRGTKGLMLSIQDNLKNKDKDDDDVPETKQRLTDPHNRPENPMDAGDNASDKFEDETGFEIDDENF
jgi:hypothetical protein